MLLPKIWIAVSCCLVQTAVALAPIGYQPLTIDQLIGQSDYTVLAKIVSVSPAVNTTGSGPINTGSTAPTNGSVATLQVLCNYIGNPPIANDSTITVQGFGTYTSDCLSYAGATGWTGFFFLNHTVTNTKLGTQGGGNTSSTDNSYQLGNHCQSPVVESPANIGTLWHSVNDTNNVVGTGCLAANGFPLQSGGAVGQPSVAGATVSGAAPSNASGSASSAPSGASSAKSLASSINASNVLFVTVLSMLAGSSVLIL
jgi:hypothetical protein